jgi:hypothetical protein
MTKLSDQLSEFAADKANLKHASLFLAAFAENLKAADIQISRRLLVIIVSMVLFELLTQGSGIKSISVFGVDLNDLTFVQLALPVLISYLYMSFAGYFSAYSYIQDAYDAIIKAAYPELFQCNLDLSLKPISDIRIYGMAFQEMSSRVQKYFTLSIAPSILAIIFGPPIFILHATESLLRLHGLSDWPVWAAIALSAFLTVQSILYLFSLLVSSDEWRR